MLTMMALSLMWSSTSLARPWADPSVTGAILTGGPPPEQTAPILATRPAKKYPIPNGTFFNRAHNSPTIYNECQTQKA